MFKNMKIGMRLALGFGFVLIMLIGIGLTGYWGVNSISNNTIKMLQGDCHRRGIFRPRPRQHPGRPAV